MRREPLLLNGHNGSQITYLSFDNDHNDNSNAGGSTSTRLASGSSDGTIILWEILNGKSSQV